MNTVLASLLAVARRHGLNPSQARLSEQYGSAPDFTDLIKIAREIGLNASLKNISWEEFVRLGNVYPIIVEQQDRDAAIVPGIKKLSDDNYSVAYLSPKTTKIETLSSDEFRQRWGGRIALVRKAEEDHKIRRKKFDLTWFIPEILREKKAFRDIAIATFALGFVGLAVPIFTQQVIDKVMVHQNTSTLIVLTIGVLIAILFEAIFSFVRTYLLTAATRKIDLRLTRQTFAHLVSLPIEYFESRTAGLIVRQIQQVSTLRGFLTGSIFFTALESVMFVIFLPILMAYSVALTLVVVVFALIMALITYSLIGPFRRRLEKTAEIESERQGMLVESVHGIRTIKALALERSHKQIWEGRTAKVMNLMFDVLQISNVAGTISGTLQKLQTIAIMVVGCYLVLDNQLSLGTLIGFQMLSARVTGPIGMFVSLIHEYQEVAVSAGMLGDIMDKPPEKPGGIGLRPTIKGRIDFEKVNFRYPSAQKNAIEKLELSVAEGQLIGIVGKSGSGKSTVAKLLQALYLPQEGIIRIDGIDIREFDIEHLRREMSVVLQDSFLLRGSIRENIAAARPTASMEDVISAARYAGATEFIEQLPQSYDTLIEENAANLSGGQRQRIAIARALISRPKILIFDEATSALDPETESIVMHSLSEIAKGRTVLMISHRLATLTRCDKIAFMDLGRVSHFAPHSELLESCPGYRHLWSQQNYG
jgi:ATP-binding cassette subfamily B protein